MRTSWWVTNDDKEFTRLARLAAERMAHSRPPAPVERYLNNDLDRGSWRLPVRKKGDE